jgi:hypothetical protein
VSRRRVFLLVAAGLLLLAVIDFWQRIYVPSATRARGEGSFQPAAVPAPLSAARIQKDLVSWLPTLRPVAGGGGTGTGAESDVSLTLLAVFVERDASFAVVRAASTAGGGTRIQSVAPGDRLYGLTVVRVEPQSVVLQGAGGEQELAIFKPDSAAVAASGADASGLPVAAPVLTVPPGGAAGMQSPPAIGQPPPIVAAQAEQAAPSQPSPGGATQQKNAEKSVEWKDGKPAQLPASMRGLKFVEAPAVPPGPKAGTTSSEPPRPQKP